MWVVMRWKSDNVCKSLNSTDSNDARTHAHIGTHTYAHIHPYLQIPATFTCERIEVKFASERKGRHSLGVWLPLASPGGLLEIQTLSPWVRATESDSTFFTRAPDHHLYITMKFEKPGLERKLYRTASGAQWVAIGHSSRGRLCRHKLQRMMFEK